jgi:hypothetical protein
MMKVFMLVYTLQESSSDKYPLATYKSVGKQREKVLKTIIKEYPFFLVPRGSSSTKSKYRSLTRKKRGAAT